MNLTSGLRRVLEDYNQARQTAFAGHPLAGFIRTDLRDNVVRRLPSSAHYQVKGSAGQGGWVRSPWLAIFDNRVTDTAQKRFCPVYLFREDFSGVYLELESRGQNC